MSERTCQTSVQNSAVEFETQRRIHVGLAVGDLQDSIAFYRDLFDQEPTKTRPGYAKFEVAEPPVNLTLNQVTGPTAPLHRVAHYGIQVKSTAEVAGYVERLESKGRKMDIEDEVACCYAVQDKLWATDPDGNRWEVFVVLNADVDQKESTASECCTDNANACGCDSLAESCCQTAC